MNLLDRTTIEQTLSVTDSGPLLIALSGGGDSTALLHLLAEECGPAGLRACVVDHALRAGSDAEARRAAGFAEALGIDVHIATLTWDAPGARAQQDTRTARYRAVCAHARTIGAGAIALAHTRDDQAETVFLRAGAGSGWRGLAGMRALAPAPLWPEGRGLWIARPLLGARRAQLRALLQERGAEWIEDPSNVNPAFARVRARQHLSELEAEGFDSMRLARLAETLASHAAALDGAAAKLIARAARFEADVALIDLGDWDGSVEVRRRALAVLIDAVSGEDHSAPVGLGEIEARFTRPGFTGATLAGARLRPRRDGVRLERDRGAVLGRADGQKPLAPLELPAGAEVVWDGRLALTAREQGWFVEADGNAQPVLMRGGEHPSHIEGGDVATRWLLSDHVGHRLGVIA